MAKLHKLETDFAKTPNWLAQDRRLSMKARGLWTYMQSLSNDWDFSIERIANSCDREGYDAIRTGILELEQFGYLSRRKVMTENGGWDMDYYLLDGRPAPGNPDQGYPDQDNRMNKKETNKKEIDTKENNTETQVAIATLPKQDNRKPWVDGILQAIEDAHGSVDGVQKTNRFAAHNLAKKLEKSGVPLEKVPNTIRAVIAAAQETGNAFIIGQTTSPRSLYQNWAKIGVALKTTAKKNEVLNIQQF